MDKAVTRRKFLKKTGVNVAVCDVDRQLCNRARELVNENYQNQDCAAYGDFHSGPLAFSHLAGSGQIGQRCLL